MSMCCAVLAVRAALAPHDEVRARCVLLRARLCSFDWAYAPVRHPTVYCDTFFNQNRIVTLSRGSTKLMILMERMCLRLASSCQPQPSLPLLVLSPVM